MKKIFTLLFASIVAFSVSAADFQLLYGDTPLANGASYERGYTEDFPGFFEQNTHLYLAGEIGVRYVLEVVADADVNVCSFDGMCVAGTNVTKSGELKSSPVDLHISTSPLSVAAMPEANKVKVTAYPMGDQTKAITVTVVLRNVPQTEIGHVDAIGIDREYVRANGKTIEYSVGEPVVLNLYSITGARIHSQRLTGIGTLRINLAPGVYIYRAGKRTGKLVLK